MNTDNELYNSLSEILIPTDTLQARITELGMQIGQDYAGETPIVLGILKGSCLFMADLVRAIPIHLNMEFMGISSYAGGTKSTGVVKITKDMETNIEGRHLIIAEDIIDTGLTLSYLLKMLEQRNPASIKICTLLNKTARRIAEVDHIGYVGFDIDDHFVVGYGLDYIEKFRNLPCIGILKPEVYQNYSIKTK